MSTGANGSRLTAEARARVLIDHRQLTGADWSVQDKKALNLLRHGVSPSEKRPSSWAWSHLTPSFATHATLREALDAE
jgi:hypothetical protein